MNLKWMYYFLVLKAFQLKRCFSWLQLNWTEHSLCNNVCIAGVLFEQLSPENPISTCGMFLDNVHLQFLPLCFGHLLLLLFGYSLPWSGSHTLFSLVPSTVRGVTPVRGQMKVSYCKQSLTPYRCSACLHINRRLGQWIDYNSMHGIVNK